MWKYLVRDLFGIEGLDIAWYGVWMAVGVLSAFWFFMRYAKKYGISQKMSDFVFYDALAAVAVGTVTGALVQDLYNLIEDPAAGFHLGGGRTFIGGLLGGVLTFYIGWLLFRKKLPEKMFNIVPCLPCSIILAHAFGRIGCFFSGCCYGIPTDSFLGVQFPGLHAPVHPTQLYEAVFLFILFAITAYLVMKKRSPYSLPIYGIGYGVFRFLVEYIRDDERGKLVGSLYPSQFWGLVMIVLGIAVIPYLKKRKGELKCDSPS